MKKITKEIVKYKIWRLEWSLSGFHKLSGADIKVNNIRLKKNRVIADLTVTPDMEEKITTKEKDVEYSFKSLGL